ncbi:MAG: septum formation initiator family protein [Longimicrobiales bacterium]|nr:septum formation initiator family protein [Longimicrobiales bacterium]
MAKVRRLILPTLLGLAVYYALFGGDYSLLELHRARTEIQAQEEELTLLRTEVVYLRARADSLQNDSATLERLARESFGMIRDGEILYWTGEPRDTAADTLG